ncbi:MAG: Polysaccharide biosynthesis protein [Berkelbacteria bacterium GW2011_GWA2_38_9]|uniref:Polysaccharide biosynthesis protein n=1 Tax=Berkelbacteria bacterium GW2011_GWA2_38_9 TaxID=1618334 RepID=A0A0G0NL61_9BACT|nr:MAG: Polysaccharide biosynthesis protein [Berkelbacteria bacterium GW2011_GWA2_38_9]
MTIKKLIKGGIVIIAGTLIGSVANYAYNTLTGRFLGPENYGIFTSLMSLLAIVSVPMMAIQTVSAKFSSKFLAENRLGKVRALVSSLHRRLWPIGVAAALMIMILSGFVGRYLHIPSLVPIFILAIIFIVAFLVPITRGVIQGMQKFFQLSINTSLDALFRLGIGMALIALGFKVNGAVGGVVAGTVLAYLFSFLPIRNILKHSSEPFDKKKIMEYSWPTVVVILCLTALVNADIIMAKHYLPPVEAGHYAALSTIAKIIFYFSGPIVSVMFPMISDLYSKGERHYHLLITTLIGVFGASMAILVFFTLAPQFTIKMLYGQQFISVWHFLPSMGLVMVLYGLVNVMANYFLSINKMKFVPFLVFFTVLEVILLSFFNSSISVFIIISMLSQIVLLITLFSLYLIDKWSMISEKLHLAKEEE